MSESRHAPWLRIFVFILISAALIAGGWLFWLKQKSAPAFAVLVKANGAAMVTTTQVERSDYALDILAIGAVTALHFEDGQRVKKGDLAATCRVSVVKVCGGREFLSSAGTTTA